MVYSAEVRENSLVVTNTALLCPYHVCAQLSCILAMCMQSLHTVIHFFVVKIVLCADNAQNYFHEYNYTTKIFLITSTKNFCTKIYQTKKKRITVYLHCMDNEGSSDQLASRNAHPSFLLLELVNQGTVLFEMVKINTKPVTNAHVSFLFAIWKLLGKHELTQKGNNSKTDIFMLWVRQ